MFYHEAADFLQSSLLQYGAKMHNLFYCPTAGDDAERCLALAAALRNAPDFVLLEQVFAPEADIFCFIFLPVQKPFRFKCDFVYGQPQQRRTLDGCRNRGTGSGGKPYRGKNVSDGRMIKGRLKSFF